MSDKVLYRIAHATDLHLNPISKIPRSRTDSFHEDIKFKFEGLSEVIKAEKVDLMLMSGDMFHLKNQSLYTPVNLNYYQKLLEDLEVDIKTIPGNHDLSKSSYDNIQKSAYKSLTEMAQNVQDLAWKKISRKITCDNKEIDINIFGLPYYPLEKLLGYLKGFHDKVISTHNGINIVMLHIDALPNNDIPLFWQTISYKELLKYIPNVNIVCLGHIHQSFDVFSENGQMISKPWAFSRVVNDAYVRSAALEKMHKPSIAIIEFIDRDGKLIVEINYKSIPFVKFDLAFKKEDLLKALDKSKKVKSFVEELKKQYGSVSDAFKIESPEDFLQSLDISKEVLDCIEHYLEDRD
jgi:DNA repair exonuclease SbcCD nuclease subunit